MFGVDGIHEDFRGTGPELTASRPSPILQTMMSRNVDGTVINIGAISRATGIPTGTLRTWERRYGFPDPKRDASGHRVYDTGLIDRLRLTKRVLEAGHRPSNVVGMPCEELRSLLEAADLDAPSSDTVDGAQRDDVSADIEEDWLREWLEACLDLDGEELVRGFRNDWNRLGPLEFVARRVGPFLRAIGEEWASENLAVHHEHYASECLRDFLSDRWRARTTRAEKPTALLAAPEDELHALGLHIVATIFAVADWKLIFLGPNTPVEEVVEAALARDVDAVAVSISESFAAPRATSYLSELRDRIPGNIGLLVGGDGAPETADDIRQFETLETFYGWAFERAA